MCRLLGLPPGPPGAQVASIPEWLKRYRLGAPGATQKGAQSLILLTAWELWRERNRRVFEHRELYVEAMVARIIDEALLWNLAGASIPFDPG